MAKEKTQFDVELARIKAGLERTRIISGVYRLGVILFFATLMVGIFAWAAVRMTDKPAWLTLVLATLAAGGGPILVVLRIRVRWKSRDGNFEGGRQSKG